MSEPDEGGFGLLAAPAAEVALLGEVLRSGELPADVEALVRPEDFANPTRGAVYAAMLALVADGRKCDHAAVMTQVDPAALRVLNNGLQLIEFMEFAPVGQAVFHAQVIADTAERQRYVGAGMQIMQAARAGVDHLGDLVRAAVDAVPRAGGRSNQRPAWEVLQEILDPEIGPPGVPMGLPDLDDWINPLLPGAVTAIGARSGVGKTTFALDVLRRAAYRLGKRALFVSIEMTDREVYTKLLSAEARVDHTKVMRGDPLNPGEETRIGDALNRIGNGSLHVADVDALSVADYRALVREYKPDITAIDFLGMATLPKADRHDLAIAEFVYAVKRISGEEQCHTMILSQFNRAADQRTDKRPHMGDFKDSSGLENAAHLALLLHRPDLYDEEERPGEVDVYIGKQRNGAAGHVIPLAAQLHYSQFTSLSQQAPPPSWRPEAMDYTEPQRADEA